MKLSKKKWLFLGTGIFIILSAGLGIIWSQRVQAQGQLKQELSLAQLRLRKTEDVRRPSPQLEALQYRSTLIPLQITDAKANLSQLLETIEVDETLFGIAETSGVKILQITSSPPTDMKLDGIPCSALRQSMQIEGNEDNILDFIRKWTEKFPTGTVVSVQITQGGAGATPEQEPTMPEQESTPTPLPLWKSATIDLIIYTYSGD